jgi:SAM-dependent methyltransferase
MRASTPEHWDRWWTDHREVEETYSNDDRLLSQLADLPMDGRMVLEVGAGSGRDSVALARRGARVVVVDYVMSSFAVVREQARAAGVGILCVCADARRMPFRDRTFDLVFHQGLMEHFREPLPLVRENFRVIRPGGHCLIDVPQRYHIYTAVKHVMIGLNRWFAGWETEFSPGELARLMRSAGFEIQRIGGDWMVPGFWYRSLRYGLRRARLARLPLQPREAPLIGPAMRRLREWFRRTRLGPNTFAMVNALGERPDVEDGPAAVASGGSGGSVV